MVLLDGATVQSPEQRQVGAPQLSLPLCVNIHDPPAILLIVYRLTSAVQVNTHLAPRCVVTGQLCASTNEMLKANAISSLKKLPLRPHTTERAVITCGLSALLRNEKKNAHPQ